MDKSIIESILSLAEIKISKKEMQNLVKNKEEFWKQIDTAVSALSGNNQYPYEEKKYKHRVYPSTYKIKDITEQVCILREIFPEIYFTYEELGVEKTLPKKAEGWFAIPKWKKIAPTYNEAVEKVLGLIKKTRGYACDKNRNYPNHLRQSEKSKKAWEKLKMDQKNNDILVIPAQFGLLHVGRSVRRAREIMRTNEFGLGLYEVGIMLLTHPERLIDRGDLSICCAGDEISRDGEDNKFFEYPSLKIYRLLYDTKDGLNQFSSHINEFFESSGSASGFIPE